MKYYSEVVPSTLALGSCAAVSSCQALGEMLCVCTTKAKTAYHLHDCFLACHAGVSSSISPIRLGPPLPAARG